jgi:UDP-glucose 4-epimerase
MDPNKATIIVTGSSGLIGSPLCTILGGTYNVVGFDRAGPPYPPIDVE